MNDNNRDGFMQQAVHEGVRPYTPNSLGGGCPFAGPATAPTPTCPDPGRRAEGEAATRELRRPLQPGDAVLPLAHRRRTGAHRRTPSASSSPSASAPEIRERMVANLGEVDADLAEQVAAHLGLDAPDGRADRTGC